MNSDVSKLIAIYRSKGVLLDSNLLILLLVGTYDRDLIGIDKRLADYIPEDLDALLSLIKNFREVFTTPSILTEVSNLSQHLDSAFISVFVSHIKIAAETHVESRKLCDDDLFSKVGLTDTGIACVAGGTLLVLTDDFRLAGHLQKRKIDVLNFNHIRTYAWK